MMRTVLGALVLTLGLASRSLASDPANEQLVFTGATAAGQTSLTFANNVYSFTFSGDEVLTYQLDMNDPMVHGGMLRIHELSSDCDPIDTGGVIYRDTAGNYWPSSLNYTSTTLTSATMSGTTLTLDFLLNHNGSHPFRYEIRMLGKELRIRASDPTGNLNLSNNFSGLAFGLSTGVDHPVPIRMQGALAQPITMFRTQTPSGTAHFYTANFLDMHQSNASDYRIDGLVSPTIGPDSTTYCLDTPAFYNKLTNGKLAAPLDDTILLVVSSKIRDVLLDSTAPISPYHSLLSNRMFFDGTDKLWPDYDQLFDLYNSLGMYNLAGYFFFQWTSSVVDFPATSSVGPDWTPAFDATHFQSMIQHGNASGIVLGAYTAFNCLPPTAPASVTNPAEIVKDSNGIDKTYFGLGFPLLGVEASGQHALSEAAKLKAIGVNAAYLDIQTYGSVSKSPDGGHIDQKSTSPWSKTMRQGQAAQAGWFESLRDTLSGPLIGEGSIGDVNTNMEFLYYGHVDSTQRAINTGVAADAWTLPAGSPYAPTNWPIIPEYEWRVAAKNQVNHGNGFYHRFFGPSDGPTVVMNDGQPILPLTQDAMDLYDAFLISYGHAGFLITSGVQYTGGPEITDEGYLTHAAAAQTYFMTNALQSLYYASPIATIRYLYNGDWKSFEQVMAATESLDSFRHIPIMLFFQNGLRIYVNHGSVPLTIKDRSVNYTLPAKTGWYATMGNGWFVAFSAIPPGTGNNRIDYCKATGQYEYFNGRGQVSGYGSLSTPVKRSTWKVTPTNLSVTEDGSGILTSTLGTPPNLTAIKILPDSFPLAAGERAGLKAIAIFDNGGVMDLTTVLHWYSSQPGVATVNEAGVVTAISSGDTKIVATDPTGSVLSVPITLSVP